jgi:hypothetical protein
MPVRPSEAHAVINERRLPTACRRAGVYGLPHISVAEPQIGNKSANEIVRIFDRRRNALGSEIENAGLSRIAW